mmetsp:Transcript_42873/g.41205  ORF Transcript_42873/g.41205 Transcript_42873/m.41205 type:complete len:121 (+) Transcript_42873:4-366(+)
MSVPTTRPSRHLLQQPQNINEFKNTVYQTLAKFGDNSTLKYAMEEVKEIMSEQITDSERMNVFIAFISDINDQMKQSQKKEQIKLFGLLGEYFGEKVIPFLPKILQFYQKKFKDIDPALC